MVCCMEVRTCMRGVVGVCGLIRNNCQSSVIAVCIIVVIALQC